MTAAELAKMLEGWPEGARPNMEFIEGSFARDGGGFAYTIHDEHAIDLACMSGLRWLLTQDKSVEFCEWFTGVRVWRPEARGFDGPTLIHAIDAAIKATS